MFLYLMFLAEAHNGSPLIGVNSGLTDIHMVQIVHVHAKMLETTPFSLS